jgi:hypothetical protein
MTKPCGIDVISICILDMGMRAQCNKEKAGDFLSIMPIYNARLGAHPMRTHQFGRKIKLPATIAIKHQIRMRMAQYEIKKAETEARAEVFSRTTIVLQ